MIDRPITLAAARPIEAGKFRNTLEQRRFARAVLADDDGNRLLEIKIEAIAQERQAEGIGLRLLDLLEVEPHALQVGRRQIDGATVFSGHFRTMAD